MDSGPENIAARLRREDGTNFELAVRDALAYLGLDATWVGEQGQGQVDVIGKSRWAALPFKVVIECNARHSGAQVGKDKVDQVRGNGKRHMSDDSNVHMAVVGRPIFSSTAKRNSEDDVSLIRADDLANLVLEHRQSNFCNDSLEEIFSHWGERGTKIEELMASSRKRHNKALSACALVIVVLSRLQSDGSSVDSGVLMSKLEAYGEALGVGLYTGDEIRRALFLLGPPFVDLINVKKDGVSLRSVSIEAALLRVDFYGEAIFEKYKQIEKALESARVKAESQE